MKKVIGESNITSHINRYLSNEERLSLQEYLSSAKNRSYKRIDDYKDIKNVISTKELNYSESEVLRIYSGFSYLHINNLLRGLWNYESEGNLDKKSYSELAEELNKIIMLKYSSVSNIQVYRGVNISYFNNYGIYDLNDLKYLQGKMLCDTGFVSTSLLEQTSYFGKKLDNGINCNVEIIYNVPSEFKEGIWLENSDLSYSTGQNEFLFNTEVLGVVDNVEILDNGTAKIYVTTVPKEIYMFNYSNYVNDLRGKNNTK